MYHNAVDILATETSTFRSSADITNALCRDSKQAHILHVGRGNVGTAGGAEVGAQGLQHSREHLDEGYQLGQALLWSRALFRRHREVIRHTS